MGTQSKLQYKKTGHFWKLMDDSRIQQFAVMCFLLSRQNWKCAVTPVLNIPAAWIHVDGSVSGDCNRYWWVWIAPCCSLCLPAFKVISWLQFDSGDGRVCNTGDIGCLEAVANVECGIKWKSHFANESAFLSTLKQAIWTKALEVFPQQSYTPTPPFPFCFLSLNTHMHTHTNHQ